MSVYNILTNDLKAIAESKYAHSNVMFQLVTFKALTIPDPFSTCRSDEFSFLLSNLNGSTDDNPLLTEKYAALLEHRSRECARVCTVYKMNESIDAAIERELRRARTNVIDLFFDILQDYELTLHVLKTDVSLAKGAKLSAAQTRFSAYKRKAMIFQRYTLYFSTRTLETVQNQINQEKE